MYIILKYAKSHIYELHALLAGSLAFILMFWAKKPVKAWLNVFTEKRTKSSKKWEENKAVYRRRLGLILTLLDLFLSAVIFYVISILSPMIDFSGFPMLLSGILSLTVYSFYEQITCGRKKDRDE